jgi:uncharacterized protein YlaI
MGENIKNAKRPTMKEYRTLGLPMSATFEMVEERWNKLISEILATTKEHKWDEETSARYGDINDAYYNIHNWNLKQVELEEKQREWEAKQQAFEEARARARANPPPVRIVDEEEPSTDYERINREEEAEQEPIRNNPLSPFVCNVCRKHFATKQKLQQHQNKRFKCEPPKEPVATAETTKKHTCVCGKSYTHQTSLCRHRETCEKVYKPNTAKALKDETMKVNNYMEEALTYNEVRYQKWVTETNTERYRYKVQKMRSVLWCVWERYQNLTLSMIREIYFDNPANFTFFQHNLNDTQVWTHKDGACHTLDVDDVHKHMMQTIRDEFDHILTNMLPEGTKEYHPFDFIANFMVEHEDNENVMKVTKNIKQGINNLIKEYKTDIHRVWCTRGPFRD